MYISDSAVTNKIQAQLNSESAQTRKTSTNNIAKNENAQGAPSTIDPLTSPAVVLELSDKAKESLQKIDPLQQKDNVVETELSDEAKEALKKIADSVLGDGNVYSNISTAEETPGTTTQQAEEQFEAITDTEEAEDGDSTDPTKKTSPNGKELNKEDFQVIESLKKRDAAVRAHETAHATAGGGLTGSPSYEYQTGPDGKRYAVGGHVSIDTSPGKTPEETLAKAAKIQAAATAPADPSPADRAIAASAGQMAADARSEILEKNQKEAEQALEKLNEKAEAAAEEAAPEATNTALIDPNEEQSNALTQAQEQGNAPTVINIAAITDTNDQQPNATTQAQEAENSSTVSGTIEQQFSGVDSATESNDSSPEQSINQPIPITSDGIQTTSTTSTDDQNEQNSSNVISTSGGGRRIIETEMQVETSNLQLDQSKNSLKNFNSLLESNENKQEISAYQNTATS